MSEPREQVCDASGRIGEVMMRLSYQSGDRVWLRPPGGGREWDVLADSVTPVDASALQEPAEAAE